MRYLASFALACAAATAALLLAGGCSRSEPVERIEWPVMGTVAAVQTRGAAATDSARSARAIAQASFRAVENLLNAHDPNSELSRLATLPEAEILNKCTPSVCECYAAAFRLMRESQGAFNPHWRGPGTLDLGAIAKGFAVDCAGRALNDAEDLLLDLGGNLKAIAGSWRTGIAGSERVIVLTNGMACATSAEYYRGKHIRDGRTGLAVANAVKSVTVVHPSSAMLADGLSTTLFVLGREAGEKFLRERYPEATAYWILK